MKPSISVVIPVYNSEQSIEPLCTRLKPVLDQLSQAHEIMLVDDGSRDRSWQVIQRLSGEHEDVRGMRLFRNSGQHNALLCGIRAAQHDIIVTMDDDLQHPPEEIGKLLAPLEDGFDVVYGTPARARHASWRNISSRITKLILERVIGIHTAVDISAFRAFRTRLRQAFDLYANTWTSIDVLLAWGTEKFTTVQVTHNPSANQRSRYTLRTLIRHALNMLIGFSTMPLRIASLLGFITTLFGLLILFFVLIRYLIEGGVVPGFSFIASTIAIFSGIQLFVLGLISEYLARIYIRAMDRQPYVIAARAGFD